LTGDNLRLENQETYRLRGLEEEAIEALGVLGDLLLKSPVNVTGHTAPGEIERNHFLDSLSLLEVEPLRRVRSIVDVGSGGGFPALVLALALPQSRIVALDSVGKKCRFIREAAEVLGLRNLEVEQARAEEAGRGKYRGFFEAGVARAVAGLPVDAELVVPLLRMGGVFVDMKGAMSNEELTHGKTALGILGAQYEEIRSVEPFPGADNRWLFVARKIAATPDRYPRRTGVPAKRPLGVK